MDSARSRYRFRLTIKKVEKPFSDRFDEEFNWLCSSLGFFEPIDKEKTAATVFKEIVKSTEKNKLLTSTQLAKKIHMSRGAIINHLNNLMRSGLIEREGRFYKARSKSIFRIIEELEEDIDRIFDKMKKTALDLDKEMGLKVKVKK